MKKLLLHICCIGCGVYVNRLLDKSYELTLFFYNPNIYPQKEYDKRLEEIRKVAKTEKIDIIIDKYEHDKWLELVKGLENEPEKGKRCLLCYEDRLRRTAEIASSKGFDIFASTLSISPHKNFETLNNIGKKLAIEFGLEFLKEDFKKQDGFKKSCLLSKELGLYRQNYCGCEFSIK